MVVALVAAGLAVALLRLAADRDAERSAQPSSAGTAAPATPATAPLPACEHASRPALLAEPGQWRLTLVDTARRLPRDYAPPNLVGADAAGFPGPFLVRSVVVEDLRALGRAAEAAGNPVDIVAAYRTFEQQRELFELRVSELGERGALRKAARPGHSEHQLGTAVDFKTRGAEDVDLAWESTRAGRWMAENAHRFGFVMSYPAGAQARTCYAYEPWHFRYVGRELAADVRASGLTLREYLWREAVRRGAVR